jgi:hypothetical protein
MALGKTLVLDTGVTVTYFRIDSLTFKSGKISVVVGAYTNQAAASENKKPVVSQAIEFSSNQYTRELIDSGNLLSTVYTAIKNFASGPSTIGDIQIDKKYLSGTFSDA